MIRIKNKVTGVHLWIIKWLLVDWFMVNLFILALLYLFASNFDETEWAVWGSMMFLTATGAVLSFVSFFRKQFNVLVRAYIRDNIDDVRELVKEMSNKPSTPDA